MALEPPPTQATTSSGRWPKRSRTWAMASSPITAWKSRTMAGYGRGSGDGADAVERVAHVGHPVAQRLVHRVLERAGAALDGDDGRAQQAHAHHVELLPAHVLGAHVHGALEVEQGAGGGGGHAVLAGAGLGDHAALAHALREQRLPEDVVDLVGAGVAEVLALEDDGGAAALAEPLGVEQRRRPAGVVAEEAGELGLEGRVARRILIRQRQLVEGRDERLGDEPPAVRAVPRLDAHPVVLLGLGGGATSAVRPPPLLCRHVPRRRRSHAVRRGPCGRARPPLRSRRPPRRGCRARIASATLAGRRPPARTRPALGVRGSAASASQSSVSPVPP